jgi:drug/metabolite transporter (DMT)-like permease
MSAPSELHHTTRPLDAAAIALIVLLCLSWGFNQVAVKLAMHDIPPLLQSTIRSALGALIVALWCRMRGIPLFARDGTLIPGLAAGVAFAAEFYCVFQGLVYTTASRAVLFIYLAPFFVVLGARFVLPDDRFKPWQWAGLGLSFAGMVVAFGLPTPALDPRQMLGDILMVAAALAWAITTLIIKATRLSAIASEKVLLSQLDVSVPLLGGAAYAAGETITRMPDALALSSLAYQTIWVVSVTFAIWFAMVKKFSANRVSAFTFLTPLFGVAAGYLVLGEPLTPAFAAAVALVAGGLVLVNRTK